MIILDNVSLRIKKVQILEGISLELEDGQIHGLVGRNGCGKIIGPEEIRDAMKHVELDPDSRLHVKKIQHGHAAASGDCSGNHGTSASSGVG